MDVAIDPGDGSGGGGTYNPPYTMITSEDIGYGNFVVKNYTYANAIMDLKVIKGNSSSIGTSDLPGYYKIAADLNRGAGGKYIYLCFTRDPAKVQGSSRWVDDYEMGRDVPIRSVEVVSQTIGTAPRFDDMYMPPVEVKDNFGFHMADLNDGAAGKYIYAYQRKGADNPNYPPLQIVKEVGVIYGSSSSITPPAPWEKIPKDLNEGAGGDYIYFIVKY